MTGALFYLDFRLLMGFARDKGELSITFTSRYIYVLEGLGRQFMDSCFFFLSQFCFLTFHLGS